MRRRLLIRPARSRRRPGGRCNAVRAATSCCGHHFASAPRRIRCSNPTCAILFLRENPVPLILGALAAGLAIGLAIRYAATSEEKEIEVKSPLGRVDLGLLSLPFLWPILKSLKEKYQDSADAVRDGVGRVKKIDIERYTKPVRKRWKAWTH